MLFVFSPHPKSFWETEVGAAQIVGKNGKFCQLWTRKQYVAVTKQSYDGILSERIGKLALGYAQIPLIVFDAETEEIIKWIP